MKLGKSVTINNLKAVAGLNAIVSFCFLVLSGFAELQTDMTDLTKELNRSQGIPFLEYKQFVTRTFFPKVRNPISPLLSDFKQQTDSIIFPYM